MSGVTFYRVRRSHLPRAPETLRRASPGRVRTLGRRPIAAICGYFSKFLLGIFESLFLFYQETNKFRT